MMYLSQFCDRRFDNVKYRANHLRRIHSFSLRYNAAPIVWYKFFDQEISGATREKSFTSSEGASLSYHMSRYRIVALRVLNTRLCVLIY